MDVTSSTAKLSLKILFKLKHKYLSEAGDIILKLVHAVARQYLGYYYR